MNDFEQDIQHIQRQVKYKFRNMKVKYIIKPPGELLTKLRKQKGYRTLEDLSDHVGISISHLGQMEADKSNITKDIWLKLSAFYEMNKLDADIMWAHICNYRPKVTFNLYYSQPSARLLVNKLYNCMDKMTQDMAIEIMDMLDN